MRDLGAVPCINVSSDQATMFRHHGFLSDVTGFLMARVVPANGFSGHFSGDGNCGARSRAVNRAIRSFPGVGEGRTRMADPSVRSAASTGRLCRISAAPRRSRLTTASAVSSSNAIHRTMGTPGSDRVRDGGQSDSIVPRGSKNRRPPSGGF